MVFLVASVWAASCVGRSGRYRGLYLDARLPWIGICRAPLTRCYRVSGGRCFPGLVWALIGVVVAVDFLVVGLH